MRRPPLRVADVFRAGWQEYERTHAIAPHQARAVRHILRCRTAALGGHLWRCDTCGREVPLYNSCQSRHCPTCQTSAKEQWLQARHGEILPVEYFHVVFTLPHQLNGLVDANRALLLGELFTTVNWVLQHFAADPQWRLQGLLGFLAILHTWTQKLEEHFHLHCLIPGGVWRATAKPLGEDGRAGTGQWIPCRDHWLFDKDALADAFRNRFLRRLEALRSAGRLVLRAAAGPLADPTVWNDLLRDLRALHWVVYPKPAPGGPEQVLDYFGRYTHKVAISDHRIETLRDGQVTYTWRDRSHHNHLERDVLPVEEFIRRFLYHILPDGFHKIRYYGWLAAANRDQMLVAIRAALHAQPPPPARQETLAERLLRLTGVDISRCPACRRGHLTKTAIRIQPIRGPP